MTQIEVRPWRDLPITPPYPEIHYCGGLQVLLDGRALLFVNDAASDHPGGFCENTDRLEDYAADVLAQFEARGPTDGWSPLADGSHITALTDADYAADTGLEGQVAPPRG
jgi:hypothetical protein